MTAAGLDSILFISVAVAGFMEESIVPKDYIVTDKYILIPPKACGGVCHDCANECTRKLKPHLQPKDAFERLYELADFSLAIERIPVGEALNRITAQDIYAINNVPNHSVTMKDGIVVNWQLYLERRSQGQCTFAPGEFQLGNMGTPVYPPFDTNCNAEQCHFNADGSVTIDDELVHHQGIEPEGSTVQKGDLLIRNGKKLTASMLSFLYYNGITDVLVLKKPRVTIIPTGGELVALGEASGPGQFVESDSIYIKCIAEQCGAVVMVSRIIGDNSLRIRHAIERALPDSDLLVVIGGVGKGEKRFNDYSMQAIRNIGTIVTHGLACEPGGSPTLVAVIGGTPVLGIPGPPHAMLNMTNRVLPPTIELFYQTPYFEETTVDAVLGADFPPTGKNDWHVRVNAQKINDEIIVTPLADGGDGVDNFVDAAAYICLREIDKPYHKGKRVQVKLVVNQRSLEGI